MPQLMLKDEMWSKLKAIQLEDRVYNKRKHLYTMEGLLYRLRVCSPWRDLADYVGLRNTIYRRFYSGQEKVFYSDCARHYRQIAIRSWNLLMGVILKRINSF